MQIKHLRNFQLSIYSHKINTFARIFFINFRISCQKDVGSTVLVSMVPTCIAPVIVVPVVPVVHAYIIIVVIIKH